MNVAFVGAGAHVVAMATTTGQALFDYKTSKAIDGAASISNGVLYIGNQDGHLYAFGL